MRATTPSITSIATTRYLNYPLRAVHDSHPGKRKDVVRFISWYYTRLVEDGVLSKCFHDVIIDDIQQFVDIIFNPQNLFYLILDTDTPMMEPVGHALLNGFYGRTAIVHFSIVKSRYGKDARDIAAESLWQALGVVDNLIGITPVSNKLALRFAKRMGFKELAVLRNTCYMAKTDTYEDGVLSLCRR